MARYVVSETSSFDILVTRSPISSSVSFPFPVPFTLEPVVVPLVLLAFFSFCCLLLRRFLSHCSSSSLSSFESSLSPSLSDKSLSVSVSESDEFFRLFFFPLYNVSSSS